MGTTKCGKKAVMVYIWVTGESGNLSHECAEQMIGLCCTVDWPLQNTILSADTEATAIKRYRKSMVSDSMRRRWNHRMEKIKKVIYKKLKRVYNAHQ